MHLDVPTLFIVLVAVTAVVALLMFWTWFQNRRIEALAWWGGAYLCGSLGSAFAALRGIIPNFLSIDLANAALITAYGLMWTSARIFNGRKPHPGLLYAALFWLLACQIEPFYASLPARVTAMSLATCCYTLLAALEFSRVSEPLPSKYPTIACLVAHGIVFLIRVPAALLSPNTTDFRAFSGFLFDFIAFEGVVFAVMAAFLLLAMAKERIELQHRIAAQIDPLTGALNRRAFLHQAGRIWKRSNADRKPIAVLAFDLDLFKTINDEHGHHLGDETLKLFCSVLAERLRPTDVFGRMGGEEFSAVLNADAGCAREIAERIGREFSLRGKVIGERRVHATVSVGVAAAERSEASLQDLLVSADAALYRAKQLGRNRVELADRNRTAGARSSHVHPDLGLAAD